LNEDKNIVIIGCGAGGGTAAQFARKTNRKAKITIFEKGKYPQYSKCGLPYAISGKIPKIENLIEFDKDWFAKSKIDLFLETTVEKIDTKKKKIYAKKVNKTIEKTYDSLIIATGAKPFKPKIENNDLDGVFTLRTIEDAKKIKTYIKSCKYATILGAGLIGLEMAENLYKLGLNITIVEALPGILSNNLDGDMAKIVAEKIPDKIKIFTNSQTTKVIGNNKISEVIIKNKETNSENKIPTNILIIATGNKPEVSLAKSIGCKIGNSGGVLVNSKSETNIKNVYAIGDCTEFLDFITAKYILVGLGSIAVRQAIAAGTNAAGGLYELPKGILNTSTSKFFDLEVASVGPTTARLNDYTVVSAHFNGSSLPDYFPGGRPVSVKVIVDKYTGMIISAQILGENAAQRVNTISAAILGELDVETFRKLETAYAPPIAPTLDAITLVCDIISKKLKR